MSIGVCLVRTEKYMHYCGLVWWVHRGATVCARSVSMCSRACVDGCECIYVCIVSLGRYGCACVQIFMYRCLGKMMYIRTYIHR